MVHDKLVRHSRIHLLQSEDELFCAEDYDDTQIAEIWWALPGPSLLRMFPYHPCTSLLQFYKRRDAL